MSATKETYEEYSAHKKESNSWDYKRELNIETKSEKYNLIKDFLAFANFGGGYLLLGIDNDDFTLHNQTPIDQARIGDILETNFGFNIEFEITYFDKEQNNANIKLGIIYIHPSKRIITSPKQFQGENNKVIIGLNDILTRRNTKSTKADSDDLEKINKRVSEGAKNVHIDEASNIKPRIYKTNQQRVEALWNTLNNKYEFSSEQLAIKLRGILYFSKHSKLDFANLIGVDSKTFEKVIDGSIIPDINVLIRVSKIFNIDMEFFFQNDYHGRKPFWKEDLVRLSIFQKVKPIVDINKLKNQDHILGQIVYTTANNIVNFCDF